MKNFIFISPNFPDNYYRFCRELKNCGFNVLGVGDCRYDELSDELKCSLTEYYKVGNLKNYEEVYRAVAFFAFKYGKIDFLESNNEYWLEQDARLRTDFNIATGFHTRDMKKIKYKSAMKTGYKKAGIPTARFCKVGGRKAIEKFIGLVGFPVIVKPDNGVGASNTYKLNSEAELKSFLETKPCGYIMEEYIDGTICTYDAIVDGSGQPVFESGNVETAPLMDVVNERQDSLYYTLACPYPDVAEAGRKTLKAFNVKNRFVHFEFFRLDSDQHIGKKGEIVALEVNMRPCGGCSTDMMNFAQSTDVYRIWAEVLAFGERRKQSEGRFYCAYAGRRNGREYFYSDAELAEKYMSNIKSMETVPGALSDMMGDRNFMANFENSEEMDRFFSDAVRTN